MTCDFFQTKNMGYPTFEEEINRYNESRSKDIKRNMYKIFETCIRCIREGESIKDIVGDELDYIAPKLVMFYLMHTACKDVSLKRCLSIAYASVFIPNKEELESHIVLNATHEFFKRFFTYDSSEELLRITIYKDMFECAPCVVYPPQPMPPFASQ